MSELVMVPVPADRVLDVYALLSREASPGEQGAQDGASATTVWNSELISRAYRESPLPMKGIFKYLSDHPERDVWADELAEKIERTRPQMAGVLGAFGRRTKNRYAKRSWPFHATWDDGRHMVVYKMDHDVAEVVREARGEE